MNRRHFILHSSIFSASALSISRTLMAECSFCRKNSDSYADLKVGVASYSLRKFSLDEALRMTNKLGVKYITLKDFHLPLQCTPDEAVSARKKVEAASLILMGGGVIYMENEAETRRAFAYAKAAGMPTIVASPAPELLDLVAILAKENDVRVAIHNHGPGDKRYPSPYDVLKAVESRDSHLGLCIDVGHTVRIGVDPVKAIFDCSRRLYDFHIKDVTQAEPSGETIEVGRGIIDVVGVLKALRTIKFSGHLALEYEIQPEDPMPGMIESFGYMRGILATLS
jgi:inosose dehydratase